MTTQAVILRILPFRESSAIVTLYSYDAGKITGIAKGIRRAKNAMGPFERGFHGELIVHSKPQRELHTLSGITISNYFPSTRSDLNKSALRDVALEMMLKGTIENDPHMDLYTLLLDFLNRLEVCDMRNGQFLLLWKFLIHFASEAGFALDFTRCIVCGKSTLNSDTYMLLARGGVGCPTCCNEFNPATRIPRSIASYFSGNSAESLQESNHDLLRITRLLIAHCRYRLDIKSQLSSLEFLESVL